LTKLRLEPILTPNEWFVDLMGVCKEVAGGKLVKNISTYPNLQATLVHPETTRDFEYACQVSSFKVPTLFLNIFSSNKKFKSQES